MPCIVGHPVLLPQMQQWRFPRHPPPMIIRPKCFLRFSPTYGKLYVSSGGKQSYALSKATSLLSFQLSHHAPGHDPTRVSAIDPMPLPVMRGRSLTRCLRNTCIVRCACWNYAWMPSDGPKPFRHVPAQARQARQAAAKSLIAGHNEFDEGETTAGMSKGCAPRYDYGSKVAGEARVRRVGSFD